MKLTRSVSSYNVRLGKNKSLLKEYQVNGIRTVYLNDLDEFQIQLHNPTSEEIGVSIKLNGKSITNDTYIVLRPGEITWLERYIDTKNRFRFTTYDVRDDEASDEITKDNGLIEVSFHSKVNNTQRSNNITWTYYPSYTCYYNNTYIPNKDNNVYCSAISTEGSNNIFLNATSLKTNSCSSYSIDGGNSTCATTVAITNGDVTKKVGIIEKGEHSRQEFGDSYSTFYVFPYSTEKIKILPTEYKPISQNDIQKMYCPSCGRKIKSKFKFCPYCGEKI